MADVEHAVKVITIDASLQDEVKRLEGEGWELIPGILPVAVYHLVRIKGKQPFSQAGRGQLGVDDTKVHVIRDGKVIN